MRIRNHGIRYFKSARDVLSSGLRFLCLKVEILKLRAINHVERTSRAFLLVYLEPKC